MRKESMALDTVKHILVVDDDDGMRSFVRELLKMNNFKITEAANGIEGLKEFKRDMPDLVITDIIMPEMEGISFIRELRNHNKEIPIIAMTGNVHGRMEEYLNISSQIGADEVLRKPVKAEEFLEAIDRLI